MCKTVEVLDTTLFLARYHRRLWSLEVQLKRLCTTFGLGYNEAKKKVSAKKRIKAR